jgi:hypothetical protein
MFVIIMSVFGLIYAAAAVEHAREAALTLAIPPLAVLILTAMKSTGRTWPLPAVVGARVAGPNPGPTRPAHESSQNMSDRRHDPLIGGQTTAKSQRHPALAPARAAGMRSALPVPNTQTMCPGQL